MSLNDLKIPWIRITVEGLVIVASILLAFGVDAWWDSRQERAQARSLFNALLDDFEVAAASLDTIEAYHQRLTANGEILIKFGEQTAVPPEQRSSVDSLLGSHFIRPVYRPPMGTVESLMGSGRLDLFDNPKLVAALTNWTAAVEHLQNSQLDARQHFYDRIYPYLTTRVDIEDLDKGFGPWLGHPLPFEQIETDAYLLLADRELQNLLYVHWVLGINILEDEIPKVRSTLERIRQETELEIAKL